MPGVNNRVLEWIARLGTNLQEQILDLYTIRVAFRNRMWQGLNHFQTREVSRQEIQFLNDMFNVHIEKIGNLQDTDIPSQAVVKLRGIT